MRWGQCLDVSSVLQLASYLSALRTLLLIASWLCDGYCRQSHGRLGVCGINRPTFQIRVLWSVRHVQQDMREDMLTSVIHQLSAFDTPISSMMGCFSSRASLSSLSSIWYVWFLSRFQLVKNVFFVILFYHLLSQSFITLTCWTFMTNVAISGQLCQAAIFAWDDVETFTVRYVKRRIDNN